MPAYSLMARAYLSRLEGTLAGAQAYPAARNMVATALSIAPDYPPVLIEQAQLERLAGNYRAAEALLRRAKHLAPGFETYDLANLLLTVGRVDEALAEYRRSHELDPMTYSYYSSALVAVGAYGEALDTLEADIDIQPGSRSSEISKAVLAMLHVYLGNRDEATRLVDDMLDGGESLHHLTQGFLACTLGKLGRLEEAKLVYERLEQRANDSYLSPSPMFWAAVGTGNRDRIFFWLDRVVEERAFVVVSQLKTSPLLDELRDEPRFEAALDRLGLAADI